MLFDSICKIDASVRRSDAGGGSGGRNRDRTAMPAERSTQRGTIFAVAGQKRLTAMKTTETDRVGIFPVASFRGVNPPELRSAREAGCASGFRVGETASPVPSRKFSGTVFRGGLCVPATENPSRRELPVGLLCRLRRLPLFCRLPHSRGGGTGWRFPWIA